MDNKTPEINPGKEVTPTTELQEILLTKRFQQIANAHRVLEMAGKHSINLFSSFPDSHGQINTGHVQEGVPWNEEIAAGAIAQSPFKISRQEMLESHWEHHQPKLTLDKEQKNILLAETEGGKDTISDAFLYTCTLENMQEGQFGFAAGHGIGSKKVHLLPDPASVDKDKLKELYYEADLTFRGLFIKMAGKFSDTSVMLLDAGHSRWLYDWYSLHGEKDKAVQAIIYGLEFNTPFRESWLKGGRGKPQLAICDYNYNIETVVPLKQK